MLDSNEEREIFRKRLRQAMDEAKITNTALSDATGVSIQAVGGWLKTGKIARRHLPTISKTVGRSIDWLLGGKERPEITFDRNIRTPRNRGLVPLISLEQAGELIDTTGLYEPSDVEVWLPCPQSHGPYTFALRVLGDSMTSPYPGQRSYPEGTLIYVDPDASVYSGKRVIAQLLEGDGPTFKVYVEDAGRKFLRPLNPQYPIIELREGFRVIGVIIGSYLPE